MIAMIQTLTPEQYQRQFQRNSPKLSNIFLVSLISRVDNCPYTHAVIARATSLDWWMVFFAERQQEPNLRFESDRRNIITPEPRYRVREDLQAFLTFKPFDEVLLAVGNGTVSEISHREYKL